MLGGADNPNGELLSYIIGADNISGNVPEHTQRLTVTRDKPVIRDTA